METPPPRRGRPHPNDAQSFAVGNTPAEAGKTKLLRGVELGIEKHPRRGGEDVTGSCVDDFLQETPPPRRGRLKRRRVLIAADGNTPAEAGKTCFGHHRGVNSQKHPRRGGEDQEGTWST